MKAPWLRTFYHSVPRPFLDVSPGRALIPDSDCIPRSLHLASAQILPSFHSENKTTLCPAPPLAASEKPCDCKVVGDPGKPPGRLKEERGCGWEPGSRAQNGYSVGFGLRELSALSLFSWEGAPPPALGCLPMLREQRGWQAGAGSQEGTGHVPASRGAVEGGDMPGFGG